MKLSATNLSQRAAQGAVLTIDDYLATPDGTGHLPPVRAADGSPATVTVLGIDAPVARRLQNERTAKAQNRMFTAASAGRAAGAVTTGDLEAAAEAEVELLTALTVDWHGFEDDAGKALPCSPDAVASLYRECLPIRHQVLGFVTDRARFFQAQRTPPVVAALEAEG